MALTPTGPNCHFQLIVKWAGDNSKWRLSYYYSLNNKLFDFAAHKMQNEVWLGENHEIQYTLSGDGVTILAPGYFSSRCDQVFGHYRRNLWCGSISFAANGTRQITCRKSDQIENDNIMKLRLGRTIISWMAHTGQGPGISLISPCKVLPFCHGPLRNIWTFWS